MLQSCMDSSVYKNFPSISSRVAQWCYPSWIMNLDICFTYWHQLFCIGENSLIWATPSSFKMYSYFCDLQYLIYIKSTAKINQTFQAWYPWCIKTHWLLIVDSHCFRTFHISCGQHFQGCITSVPVRPLLTKCLNLLYRHTQKYQYFVSALLSAVFGNFMIMLCFPPADALFSVERKSYLPQGIVYQQEKNMM
jgi:hypothetical protein